MKIDRQKFFAAYEAAYGAIAKPEWKAGLDALLGAAEGDPQITDLRWLAYMLATVKHECAGHWLPIEEFGKGQGRPYGKPVTVTDSTGKQFTNVYYGRGYVQLTWKDNYATMGTQLGNRLVYEPQLALDPVIAYKIMSLGMRKGMFTGVGLSKYINGDKCDYFNARRIINGTDAAQKIADYATKLEAILNGSVVTTTGTVPNIPQPQPAPAGGAQFTVAADSLNVRSGPGTTNAVVSSLTRGTAVTAVAEQNGWKQITAPVAGWVSAQFLQAAAAQFTVAADTLNVRSGPGAGNAVVTTLSRGTVVTAVAEQNGWKQITAPAAGWVSAQFLQAAVPAHA